MQGEKSQQKEWPNYDHRSDGRINDVGKAEAMAYAANEYYNQINDIKNYEKHLEETGLINLGKRALRAVFPGIFPSIARGEKAAFAQKGGTKVGGMTPREVYEGMHGWGVDDGRRSNYAKWAEGEARGSIGQAMNEAGTKYNEEVLGVGDSYVGDPDKAYAMALAEDPFRDQIRGRIKELEAYQQLPFNEKFEKAKAKLGFKGQNEAYSYEEKSKIIGGYVNWLKDTRHLKNGAEEASKAVAYAYNATREAINSLKKELDDIGNKNGEGF